MIKIDPSAWTEERLAKEPTDRVRTLRQNAQRLGLDQFVISCDSELARRAPPKRLRGASSRKGSEGAVVVGYHFVCKADRGVTVFEDGSFGTASWVVAEERVKDSLARGAYVALHETRSDASYRQGKLIGYSLKPRNMLDESDAKTDMGIEFIVEPTTRSHTWHGDATGEKGYLWSDEVGDPSLGVGSDLP